MNKKLNNRCNLNNRAKGNDIIFNQHRLIEKFNNIVLKIDDYSFINLNANYIAKGINLSVDILVHDSNNNLKYQKEYVDQQYNFLAKNEKPYIDTIKKMAENKLSMLFEQNVLISHLITIFKNMKNETINYHNNKFKDSIIKSCIKNDEEEEISHLNQNEKNKYIFNTCSKELILNFLSEDIMLEDPFFMRNRIKKNIKLDNKINKDKTNSKIIFDSMFEIEEKKTSLENKIFNRKNKNNDLNNEEESYDLGSLIIFKRKEKKK
jgi:hypothetical protein